MIFPPVHLPLPIPSATGKCGCSSVTHTRELDAAVTALRRSTLLLDMKVPQFAARGLDHADPVGLGVVPIVAIIPLANYIDRGRV